MANVLVTGGSGFLGGHLVERLEADAHNVTILDVKPLQQASLSTVVS